MREYFLVFLVGLTTTVLAAPFFRSLALRTGAVAKVRSRDVHQDATPYFGGLAMLAGVAAAFLFAAHLPFLSRYDSVPREALSILGAASLICLVGVLDDLFELTPLLKAAGQVLAAAVTVAGGVRLLWIPWGDGIVTLDQTQSVVITVFAVFLITNAINFIDGLDGLAAGVVAIGAGAFFLYAYWLAAEEDLVRAMSASLVTVVTCGVCLGYLPHNFHKARMFMGDSGSMLLGLLMAASAISLTGQVDPFTLSGDEGLLASAMPLILPFAVLALPLLDLVMAFCRRTWRGQWWFKADKKHIHHMLLARGHSHIGAVLLMYGWAAAVSFGVLALGLVPSRNTLIVVAVALATIALATVVLSKPALDEQRAAARQLATAVGRRRADPAGTEGAGQAIQPTDGAGSAEGF
ncbi:MAG: undecaprenyl/decaprenyl-phosphate alpha-N-acetylglucosaminyl 1-phosphate transferase [Propionibacteriaceae bacterium]|jgi:UDP-GlcNAc:undecaprenyl-phosphate GlcNAc-1-phosphate transferase|nr:undecaprenyl/decaprenyl-phosphate alpha-N-acetylglucosaminyl 1-phosphate transferase [Propionibacteriaceae bacterium]